MIDRDPLGDDEPEPRAPGFRGVVGREEPGQLLLAQPRAGVLDLDGGAPGDDEGPHPEGPPFRHGFERVRDDVAQGAGEELRVAGHRRARGEVGLDAHLRGARLIEGQHLLGQVREVHGPEMGPRKTREVAEGLDHPPERAQLLQDGVARLAEERLEVRGSRGRLAVEGAPQGLDGELDREEGLLQLVGQASGDLAPRGNPLGLHQAGSREAQLGGHFVEGPGQGAQLVFRAHGHGDPQIAPRDLPRRLGQLADGAGQPTRDEERARQGAEEGEGGRGQPQPPNPTKRVLEGPFRGGHDQDEPGAEGGRGPTQPGLPEEDLAPRGPEDRAGPRPEGGTRGGGPAGADLVVESHLEAHEGRQAAQHLLVHEKASAQEDLATAPVAGRLRDHGQALVGPISRRHGLDPVGRAAREEAVVVGQAEAGRPVVGGDDDAGAIEELQCRQIPPAGDLVEEVVVVSGAEGGEVVGHDLRQALPGPGGERGQAQPGRVEAALERG